MIFALFCGIRAAFCRKAQFLPPLSFCCICRKFLHGIIGRFPYTVIHGAAQQCGRFSQKGKRG